MDKAQIANLYCRDEPIHNTVCDRYFKVTEKDLLNGLLHGKGAGNIVAYSPESSTRIKVHYNHVISRFLQKFRPAILLFIRELLWLLPLWKSKKLDSFLREFAPNIIYAHCHDALYVNRLLDYCVKKTGAKSVVFFGDDMYSYKSRSPLQNLYQYFLRLRLKKTIRNASLLFGGSLPLCREYSALFHKPFKPLFKGCDLSENTVKKQVHYPVRMVYAGNLLYGREQVLARLVKELKNINELGYTPYNVYMYSTTAVSDKMKQKLNVPGVSRLIEPRPYHEIQKLNSYADIVLHVESADRLQQKKTRLSFSTKIIDCMQSGSAVLAIGPAHLASIQYLQQSRAAFVAESVEEAANILTYVSRKPKCILEKATRMQLFAQTYHEQQLTRERFEKQLADLVNGGTDLKHIKESGGNQFP